MLEPLVLQAVKVLQDHRVLKAIRAYLVQLAAQDHKVTQVILVQLDQPVLQVFRVYKVFREAQVPKEIKEAQVQQV